MGDRLRILNRTIAAVFAAVSVGILIDPVVGQSSCPNGENYSPCTCFRYSNGDHDIRCYDALVEDVANTFKRTLPSRIRTFEFYPSASTGSTITIPKDLLGQHRVYYEIQLYSLIRNFSLWIEPEAFRSSNNFTERLYLRDWDISQLDFDFLAGFDSLSFLKLYQTSNVYLANWDSTPPLTNLKNIEISYSTELNEWETFPSLVRGLEILQLDNNQIQSVPMDRILSWTVGHSASTLQSLIISHNSLTIIPLQIPALTTLRNLEIEFQKPEGIPSIPTGSIKLSGPTSFLDARFNSIQTIESGAFVGNFNGAHVGLSDNNVQTIQSGAFEQGDFSGARVQLAYNNIHTIGSGAFKGNFNSAELGLSYSNLQTIEPGAFQGNFSGADVSLNSNKIQRIEPGVFQGDFSAATVSMYNNYILTIEPGAFQQGDFSGASVFLSSNNLTRFEELVFKDILDQMTSQSPGHLYASQNPFDCELDPCHLAWLIRDNRNLLEPLNAYCSNGTSFEQLNPNGFSQCGSPGGQLRTHPTSSPAPTII